MVNAAAAAAANINVLMELLLIERDDRPSLDSLSDDVAIFSGQTIHRTFILDACAA
jgi:hypothetical protein